MRRLVYQGDRTFELTEVAPPPLSAGEARVAIEAAGICGSDIHGYVGLNDRRPPGTVMGHEVSGRVIEVGEGAGIAPGTTVAVWPIVACGICDACVAGRPHLCGHRRLYGCDPGLPGGFATEMVVQADHLVELPPTLDVELGALVEPMAVGLHAVRLAGATPGSVAVIGGGPIGIAAAISAINEGAGSLTVLEPVAARREALARIGLDARPPEDAPTDLDLVVECVGFESTVRAALAISRPGGRIVMVGVAETEVTIPVMPLVIEERSLIGSSAYTLTDFRDAAALLGDPRFDLAAAVERHTDLEGAPDVFRAYAEKQTTAIKTLVVPD